MVSPDTPKPMSTWKLTNDLSDTIKEFLVSRKLPQGHNADDVMIAIAALEHQKHVLIENIIKNLRDHGKTETF